MSVKHIYWFSELNKESIPVAGGKGANLGEMWNAKFPIPEGFVISSESYFEFAAANQLDLVIRQNLQGIDIEDAARLESASAIVRNAILSAQLTDALKQDIENAFRQLCGPAGEAGVFVAVRSSATAEDLPEASFAGQQETFLNVQGREMLIQRVRECWASLFAARAVYYRQSQKFDHSKVGIAVVIQRMVQADVSGILFTADPVAHDRETMLVEAGFGLGEAVVSGSVTPDTYYIDKALLSLKQKKVSEQKRKIVRTGSGNAWVDVEGRLAQSQKLDDEKIVEIAKIGRTIEAHYGSPQDIEWAMEAGRFFVVQSRSITTLKQVQERGQGMDASDAKILVRGLNPSPGHATGPVHLILDMKQVSNVRKGEILVTTMTTPDFVPAMKRAAAIITDEGGITCHAAIVSRELGVPCIVGAGNATKILKDNMIVTVDAGAGLVYEGEVQMRKPAEKSAGPAVFSSTVVTGTRIYVNLADPDSAEKFAERDVDGIGLFRAEFLFAGFGKHPKQFIAEGKEEELIDNLARGLRKTCAAFKDKPVIYRANDFKTNEYRSMEGGAEFEPHEENPMLGYRGCFRYLKDPGVFKCEIRAIRRVREQYGLKNLDLMIPMVRTVDDFKLVRRMVEAEGLLQTRDFKLGMMCEIPSNVILAEEFCLAGADFFSIGSNDLTQLTLGVDRDNPYVAEDFDERDPAVLESIRTVIQKCHKHGVKVGICGQAPSNYPEFSEKLVEFGIDSISVNPDVIERTRRIVASAEQKVMLKSALRQG